MSEQKMREALETVHSFLFANVAPYGSGHRVHDLVQKALAAPTEPSGNSGEFAAPAGEQVGLTDAKASELGRIACAAYREELECNRTHDAAWAAAASAVIAKYEGNRTSSGPVAGTIYDPASGGAA